MQAQYELIQNPRLFFQRVHEELNVPTASVPKGTLDTPDYRLRSHQFHAKAEYLKEHVTSLARFYSRGLIPSKKKTRLVETLKQEQTFPNALNLVGKNIRKTLSKLFNFDDKFGDSLSFDARGNAVQVNFRGGLENAVATSLGLVQVAVKKLLKSYNNHVTNWDEFIEHLKPLVRNNLETLYGFSQLHLDLTRKLFNVLGDYNWYAPPVRSFSEQFFGLRTDSDNSLILAPSKDLQDALIDESRKKPFFRLTKWPFIAKLLSQGVLLNRFCLGLTKKIPIEISASYPAVGCPAMFITTEVTDPKTGEKKKVNFIELLHHLICDLLEKVLYPQLPRLLTR